MLPAHCYILSKMKKEENEATLRKLLYGNCIKLSLQAFIVQKHSLHLHYQQKKFNSLWF